MHITVSAAPRHAHVFLDIITHCWIFKDDSGKSYGLANRWCRKEYAINAARNMGFNSID